MLRPFLLIQLCLFFSLSTMAQKPKIDTLDAKFDTVRISGYIISPSPKYFFFLPSNDKRYNTVGQYLDKYFPSFDKWDPRDFVSDEVYVFNPGNLKAGDIRFFEDTRQSFLNKLALKKVLPELTTHIKYKKKGDGDNRYYAIYFIDAVWLKASIQTHRNFCKSIETQCTIVPDCSKESFNCYFLFDYYSCSPVVELKDNVMQVMQW
jgi:hypothetical protein